MRRLRLLVVATILVLGGVLYFCVSRVPSGSLGLETRNGQVTAVLPAGTHLHSPLTGVVLVPAGRHEHEGIFRLRTPEGATVASSYRVEVDLGTADPAHLTAIASSVASGEPIGQAVVSALAQSASQGQAGEGSVALERLLAGTGLVPGSLKLGTAHLQAPAQQQSSGNPNLTKPSNPLTGRWTGAKYPVLLIGLDSADWDLINPMIESGALPNLSALRKRGASATLRSMSPTLSPILWTTIATGRNPEDHGIIDFLMKDPASGAEVPISRLYRKVKALWNVASDLGLPNTTVAWWATWPAERVTGAMVTDRVAYSLFDLPSSGTQPGLVYPERLLEETQSLVVEADAITYDEVRAIVNVPPAVFEKARAVLETPDGYRDPVAHLIKILASTRTYHDIARSLVRRQAGGLSMVYYEGLDEVNHRFAQYMPPAMGLVKGTDPALAAAFSEAVPNFYRLQDRLVGELVSASPAQTVVFVVSDHGFANGRERPVDVAPDIEGAPGLWHTLDGIFMVAGPPIRAVRLENAPGLLDIAPTLLALLGLPRAQDMPGRALTEIFRHGMQPEQPQVTVASYDDIGEPLQAAGGAGASPEDAEMIARLKALGYVQSDAGGAPAAGTGTPVYHVNAGHILLGRNELDRARDEFALAHEMAPNFDQPLLGLAQVELARGRPGEALDHLEAALRVAPQMQPVLLTRTARVYLKAGQARRGLASLSGMSFQGRREAFRLTAIGMLSEAERQPDEALDAYRRALAIDPSVERALYGTYRLMKQQGNLEELASVLSRSLDVETISVAVRAANWLALTRELQGRRPESRTILTAALEKSPEDPMTLTNLGSMLVRDDEADRGIGYLERAYKVQPKNSDVLVNLIVAEGKLSRIDSARRYFKEGESVGKRPELYNAIAYACFLNGAKQDAKKYLAISLAMQPGQKEAGILKDLIDRSGR